MIQIWQAGFVAKDSKFRSSFREAIDSDISKSGDVDALRVAV
jgi:hypothetical protein